MVDTREQLEMEDVLCIITYGAIVILDMKKILDDDDWNGELPAKLPPVKRLIRFKEFNLPLAMGYLKIENSLYMFGGENPSESSLFNSYHVFSQGVYEYNVIKLDLSDPDSQPTYVGILKGPKTHPIVFEFDSKIYIFSYETHEQPNAFEVWDPVTGESSSLPNIPEQYFMLDLVGYYVDRWGFQVYVRYEGLYSFDFFSKKWNVGPSLRGRSYLYLPNWDTKFSGVPDVGNNDVNLHVSRGDLEIRLTDKSHNLMLCCLAERYQNLNVEYPMHVSAACMAKYGKQGQGPGPRYNCLLVPCSDEDKKLARVIVEIFRVDKNGSPSNKPTYQRMPMNPTGEEVFSVVSLRKQVYEFNYHRQMKNEHLLYSFQHAFIWSLPKVSGTSNKANDRNAQDSGNAGSSVVAETITGSYVNNESPLVEALTRNAQDCGNAGSSVVAGTVTCSYVNNEPPGNAQDSGNAGSGVVAETVRRSQRNTRRPAKFDDFILDF